MTTPTLTSTLQLLRDPANITRGRLRIFTDLRDRDHTTFWPEWITIPEAARIRIITLMNEISEDNLELDFRTVMRWSLDDNNAEVRRRAIDGLSEEEHPRIIPDLLDRLQHDSADDVRSQAAISLARFTAMIATDELSDQTATTLITTLKQVLATSRNHLDVYRRTLEALGSVADDTITASIAAAWQSDSAPLRESAIVAMGRSADTQWLPMIRSALQHVNAAIRFEAATAAGEYGDDASTFWRRCHLHIGRAVVAGHVVMDGAVFQ
jgi:HEAT repeat protein